MINMNNVDKMYFSKEASEAHDDLFNNASSFGISEEPYEKLIEIYTQYVWDRLPATTGASLYILDKITGGSVTTKIKEATKPFIVAFVRYRDELKQNAYPTTP